MSDNAAHNSEEFEKSLEEFASDNLPSLDDLLRELELAELAETPVPSNPLLVAESPTAPVTNSVAAHFAAGYSEKITSDAELTRARSEIHRLEQENAEMQSAYARVRSDFEKYRWRAERERSEHYAFAVMSVVRELLPILDNFSRAVTTVQDSKINTEIEFAQFLSGVNLISQQIHKVLADMGVQPIEAVGETFDPQIHEAVALEENAKFPANTILEEILRGYRLGERLIRPSLVKVSTNEG